MTKSVFHSMALRTLFPLRFIVVGFMVLLTPSVWAATLSSVPAGGNWSSVETWVGGNVPTELDSVVINGTVNVDGSMTVSGLEVSTGATLQNDYSNNHSLTVNGDVTNNGAIKNNDSRNGFYLNVSGNIVNKGTWDNSLTRFISGIEPITIEGNPISSPIIFDADFTISNSPITFGENVDFGHKTITLPPSAQITFLKQVSNAKNVGGSDTTFFFKAGDEGSSLFIEGAINGTVILSGSGEKNVSGSPTINGSLVIEESITLQNDYSNNHSLTVNGDVTNNGAIKNNASRNGFYLNVSGNIINNGTWNNARTSLTWPTLSGVTNQFNITEPSPITDISTIAWPAPSNVSTYNITELLTNNTVHYWRFRGADGDWLVRGINDPSLIPEQVTSSTTSPTAPVAAIPSPTEIHALTPSDLEAINAEEFQQVPSEYMSYFLTNLDSNQIAPADVQRLVPTGWILDLATGALTAPVGAKVTLQALPPPNVPPQVALPTLPNLNTGFGIGGAGTPVLEGMTQSLAAVNLTGFVPFQDDKGILHIENSDLKLKVTVIPGVDDIQVVDLRVKPVGISVGKGGFYQIITPDALQIPLLPAPQDPVDLSKVLDNGEVNLGKSGDVLMEIPSTSRRGGARLIVIFDWFIEPAPEDLCVKPDFGEVFCEFDNAPEHLRPGLHLPNRNVPTRRRPESGNIVYSDGTKQTIWPSLYSPKTFIETVKKFPGVEQIVFNKHGTFYVLYQGQGLIIFPTFTVQSESLSEGESVAPSIGVNTDGTLRYTVTTESSARQVLIFKAFIELASHGVCVENIHSEIVCDGF